MSDEGDDSTRFTARPSASDETRFTGVGSPPPTGGKPDATFPPGSVIGHTYRIEAFLARGGMGEVYRASHVELNTEHAIKIILPELANNQRIVDLFRREASVLRNVRHDAVVAYDGVFRDENARLYLVMEFADGPSLSKLMRERPLDADEVRQLRDRLADGLAVAHDKGVVHRDISPDNVILPGGDLGKAKIIDFGISKAVDPAVKTIIGDDFAGKFSYVSPEQLGMFGGQIDGRSDIYSLGLVLAAAALGEPLDMGLSPISVIEARRTVPDLSRVPAAVRADLAAMLQPDPAQRPQTMRELIRTPEQRGGRRSALSDTSRQSSAAKPSSGRMGALVGALAVIVVAGGALGYWYWQGRADNTTGMAQQADNGGQQSATNATQNTGGANTSSAATQQSTASTTATQAQASTSGENSGAGATGTQQQETVTGATSSSTGSTAADSGQAGASNSTIPTSNVDQSTAATTNGSGATAVTGQSQSQQENASTTAASTTTGQTAAGTTSGQQQVSNGSASITTPVADGQQSSATAGTAATGDQSVTQTPATADTTSTTTQTADAAQSNGATSQASTAATASGNAATGARDTQTALLPQVPDVEKLRGEAQSAVRGLECAGVVIDVSAQGDISASGYVESEADRAKAVAALSALPQVGRVDNAIEVQTWPLCKVLGVLQEGVAIDVGGRSAPRIDPGGPYHQGKDPLNLTITPLRDGYLYVDYIDAANADPKKRYALHLLPSPLRDPNNYVKAGKRVVIGSLPKEREIYVFNPPLGANMVLVILSPEPLFPTARPQEEDGDDAGAYLVALRAALTAVAQRAGPGKLSVGTSSLTFVTR